MEEKEYKYMVSVRCFTFNQSKYILDALHGFVMQQTNFPYVVMVVDDASTDGEQEVIRKFVSEQFDTNDTSVAYEKETDYAHITYAQHKTNKNCYIAVLYLKENHYSQRKTKMPYLAEWRDHVKYEALCEGDDYWIDAQKLQKQVDFLEENGEYSMCFTNAVIVYQDNSQPSKVFNDFKKSCEVSLKEIIDSWIIPTAGILYRKKIIENYPNWTRKIYSGDHTLALIAKSKGRIYYLNRIASIYRKNTETSVSLRISKMSNYYVYNEHIKLYKFFDEYTNYEYHGIIDCKVKQLQLTVSYLKDREKSFFYAIFRNPTYVVKKILGRLRMMCMILFK